ncbi:MAG: DUF350 domain-containing protein [Desulfobacteraceae bacterium]|nr:DUF350 domain-containing protein [Desulfobacteraceae bacterium]
MYEALEAVIPLLVFPLLVLGFMWAIKFLDDRRTRFVEDEEMLSGKNLAVSLRKSGIYLGVAFGLAGTLFGRSKGLPPGDLLNFIQAGFILMALLFVAFVVNDRIILRKVDNDKAIQEGNTALGLVEFASYASSGIIMHGAFSGEGGGILAAGVFFLLGQAALVVAFYLYEALTTRNICEEIEVKKNTAAGMDVAGLLISMAVILRASVAGAFTGWMEGLKGFGIYFVAGLCAVLLFRLLGNLIFVPGTSYDKEIAGDRNISVATLSSTVQVGVSLIIAGAF